MSIEISATPFDHQGGGDWPGSRGTHITASRPGSGIHFATQFPGIWVAASGAVEVDRYGIYPPEDIAEWLESVAAKIREQTR